MINGIKPNPIKGDFDGAVSRLLENITMKYLKHFPNSKSPILTLVAGRKFIKVIHDNSVWGFVAKLNGSHKGLLMEAGDVFKPASWASAAKHTRGNIFDNDTSWFGWTGPNYLSTNGKKEMWGVGI